MVPQPQSAMQPHRPHPRCLCGSAEPHEDLWSTWPFRGLLSQAARLYERPEAQRLALLHHARIMRQHAPTPARLLLWDDVARALDLEQAGASARRGER
jgi:hypothetical protein